MLEYRNFREILESRFGFSIGAMLISICLCLTVNYNLANFANINISVSLIAWILFVGFLSCSLSGLVTQVQSPNFLTEKIYKKINPMNNHHYWSMWYALGVLATAVICKVSEITFKGINNHIIVGSLVYASLYIFLNFQEYSFNENSKILIARFLFSRFFLGFAIICIGIYFAPKFPITDLDAAFSAIGSEKFLLSVILIVLGILVMYLKREMSTFFVALFLLLIVALTLLQAPILLVSLIDSSKISAYYKQVFLTWKMLVMLLAIGVAGAYMMYYWIKDVKL